MSGCCSGSRSVVIEATVLRVEGETCERCSSTIDAVREAAQQLESELAPFNVRVTLIEHAATEDQLADSNTVLINGRPLEQWINAERVDTDCPSCSDLVGDSVCCAALSVGDEVHEVIKADHIRDAAMAALGLGSASGSGCGCG